MCTRRPSTLMTMQVILKRMAQNVPKTRLSRRQWLHGVTCAAVWAAMKPPPVTAGERGHTIAKTTLSFICRCAREDGGYSPSPDSKYAGNSDTGSSDLAAV